MGDEYDSQTEKNEEITKVENTKKKLLILSFFYFIQLLNLILSPEYAEEIREKINEGKTQPLEYYEPMFEPQTGIYK